MKDEGLLIERIARALPSREKRGARLGLRLGIGDDAAVMRPTSAAEWVLSCDQFLEDVHFLAEIYPPEAVGYKALARATSDLGAMGAAPGYFLLSLALPARRTSKWLDRFLSGMARAARQFGMILIGGDTAQSRSVAISITVLGEIKPGRALTRSGARPGDRIYVSGTLGRAELALQLVLRGWHRTRLWQPLLRAQFYPRPPIALGRWLAVQRVASSMIDLSDGLSTDLTRLCQASGCGADLWATTIPAVTVPPTLRQRGLDPLQIALHGGEDYELLFTVPRHRENQLRAAPGKARLRCIGEITRRKGLRLVGLDGRSRAIKAGGWDHFRRKR
jgi:thiamine-monophosphate kinase